MDRKLVGIITECLPDTKFRVDFEDGKNRFCYLSGKMRSNYIRIIIGDRVEAVVPYQGDISRIIRRL